MVLLCFRLSSHQKTLNSWALADLHNFELTQESIGSSKHLFRKTFNPPLKSSNALGKIRALNAKLIGKVSRVTEPSCEQGSCVENKIAHLWLADYMVGGVIDSTADTVKRRYLWSPLISRTCREFSDF